MLASLSAGFSVTPSTNHNELGPFWFCFLSGWVCVWSGTLWVSLTSSPVILGVSPADASTPTGVFNQWFEDLFPHTGTLGCVVCHPVHQLLPRRPAAAFPTQLHNLPPCWVCQPPPCRGSSPPWLPISTSPTSLDECFFFISLVVGLPYSSIFWQFWLFSVLKLLLSFFWLCKEAQCVYLHLHLVQKLRVSFLMLS